MEAKRCEMCPRKCRTDRNSAPGLCGVGTALRASLVSRHMWEEPCISGIAGSGTVFFSGCPLKCVFCQNKELSRECAGEDISAERLSEIFLQIQLSGAHNINLVTPTQFTAQICEALAYVKDRLNVPVIWNSSGYELPGTLELTRGLVDIYMPDFKYVSNELAERYSGVPDYASVAGEALGFMYSMLGPASFTENGLMKRGLIVRHLVLPGCRKDSIEVMRRIASIVPPEKMVLSLMAQYTPDFYDGEDKKLRRRVTTFEYECVREEALRLGFSGYMQSPGAATTAFTPHFGSKLTISL